MSDTEPTEYEVGQDNIQILGLDIHNPVFGISGLTIVAFVFFALVFREQAGEFFGWLRPALTSRFDWVFMLAGNIFVLFSLALIVSPYGKIRLGGDDARPDYSYAGWFAMLFAAGMGIGLVFWGVAEPISHYGASLGGIASEGGVRTDWAPAGRGRRRPGSRPQPGHGRDHLPLGPAPLGGLCGGRAGAGLLQLQPRSAA